MNGYEKAVCLGIVSGMRSMLAPAILSRHFVRNPPHQLGGTVLGYLTSPKLAAALAVISAGELIADKLPFVPSRISAAPLLGRAVSGAICGAALCAAEGRKRDLGAIAGGVAAVASAFAFYHLRRKISEETDLPESMLAIAEDFTAVGIGLRAIND